MTRKIESMKPGIGEKFSSREEEYMVLILNRSSIFGDRNQLKKYIEAIKSNVNGLLYHLPYPTQNC